MDKRDIELVKRIIRETVHEILEEDVFPPLFNVVDAVDVGITSFRQAFATKKGVAELEKPFWDPTRIKWVDVQGVSGPYQRYPAEGEKPEASEDYKNLLTDLKEHNGKLSRKEPDGSTWFYWLFKDQASVGRKLRQQVATEHPKQLQPENKKLDDVKALFPADLQSFLSFELQGEFCVVKPRQFLDTENFARIADVVKAHGGEYVSAGKDSHFKIPVKT